MLVLLITLIVLGGCALAYGIFLFTEGEHKSGAYMLLCSLLFYGFSGWVSIKIENNFQIVQFRSFHSCIIEQIDQMGETKKKSSIQQFEQYKAIENLCSKKTGADRKEFGL